ncbi:hypothetical protein JCM15093_3435 [Bacteroides graminisolvens DSM 19988 = JCM 15093]|jgi:hypothetical protein|uniref:Uncharacterized protein n=1 Tax=Bacteroides graminisolvens DSM 19988 = JCM 15093 TaxID=1121097 RepID=A0A069D745_9BACE|nr:hypothetical protein [Bacteroides graminisolvens]GAK38126.1 hypothetical protein JCM15093_3435 [Bacteroides graminisolvens DSM 19988 = JCM 15093]
MKNYLACASDVTNLPVLGGDFAYQIIALNLFDRKIIKWSTSDGMTTEEIVKQKSLDNARPFYFR